MSSSDGMGSEAQIDYSITHVGYQVPEPGITFLDSNNDLESSDVVDNPFNGLGYKDDSGKPRMSLVFHGFAAALFEVARVGTFGARKYTDDGWCHVENGHERYTDALYRHLLYEAQGKQVDPDSDLLHSAHAAWNALARLELQLRKIKGV